MKTVTYILYSEPDPAPDGAGHTDRPRRSPPAGSGKVVDLTAWRAEHLTEPDGPEPNTLPIRRGDQGPTRRRWRLADWAELAATLAVTVAFLALAARVLLV